MTPDELEAAVLADDVQGVVALLAAATEAERLACGARMVALRKAHGEWRFSTDAGHANATSLLALLGTGTAGQIAGGRRMWRHELAETVLRLRPSPLVTELVPWMLERLGWPLVRALVRDGRIPRPAGDAYIHGMLASFVDADALLRDDPDLLGTEVWRLFEVEGTADHSLADHDKYTSDARSWSHALRARAGRELDRDRLLDASLAALERDFPAFRAGWFGRFHEALAPTRAERAERADAYLRLLRSPIGPTVTLGVAALRAVQDAGLLDGARLLAHVGPAIGARSAGTARQALRLVERAVREDPSLGGAAAGALVAGLGHPAADVQSAAIALFEQRVVPLDDGAAAQVAARAGEVAPSLRARVDALTAPGSRVPEPATRATATRRVDAVAEPVAASDPFAGLERLQPAASLEALVEALAAVLEQEGPPDRLEVALDGVLRFPRDGSAAFVRTTRAVRVRAGRILARRGGPGIAAWFAGLVVAWVDGSPTEALRDARGRIGDYLARRVDEVARTAAAGRAGTLVALPSYAGGWIEPEALVARLATRPRDDERPLDVAQALLRVLPVRRERALADAARLDGEAGDAVRHALGGTATVGPSAALWAAAARCRTPDGDDPDVARGHPGLGPDAALAGRYRVVIANGRFMRVPALDPGAPVPAARADIPTDLLWRVEAHVTGGGNERAIVDWSRLIWPQDRRSWFAVSAALLLGNLDWGEARWHDRQRLEPLFEPWTRLGSEGAALVAVALQAREPGQRGLAVDAAIALVADGRLDASRLVAAFDAVATALEPQDSGGSPVTLFRPGRLAASLDEVARRSDRHAAWALEVAAGALARMVATARPKPVPTGQLAPLVRLLVELTAVTALPVPSGARPTLEALAAGSGTTASLARRLLTGTVPS